MSKRKNAGKIAYVCFVLVLVLVMLYSGLRILESTVFHNTVPEENPIVTKTIVRDGVEYFPRQDITVIMVLGIDRYGVVEDSGSYNNPCDADMIALLIIDEANEQYNILYLNRDTMLDMPVLGIGGREAGTYYGQLALAHTYGSGLKDSCENVCKTLEAYLPGLTVDYYVSMRMDAIAILNDAVGGVTVMVEDDFSDVDPTIKKGEFTLNGNQALRYVQTRKDVGDQKNITRMKRQQNYVQSFMESFARCAETDVNFMISTFEAISPYIVTNCSANTLNGFMNRYADYALGEVVTPQGRNVIGEKYYEFYSDEEALDELILRLFYAQK